MGYNTRFNLNITPGDDYAAPDCGHLLGPEDKFCRFCGRSTKADPEDIVDRVASIMDEIGEGYDGGFIREVLSGYGDTYKWYDWKSNMTEVSKRIPGVLFVLSGKGAESEDLWKAYFKNGKSFVATAKITYEDYDESKLR